MQPPSRGCVLKQLRLWQYQALLQAAAFARLCVETRIFGSGAEQSAAAAFARLCVETLRIGGNHGTTTQPPSRGCVLKPLPLAQRSAILTQPPSRGCVLKLHAVHLRLGLLQAAAFARLCVETFTRYDGMNSQTQPPSRGCVLKQCDPLSV